MPPTAQSPSPRVVPTHCQQSTVGSGEWATAWGSSRPAQEQTAGQHEDTSSWHWHRQHPIPHEQLSAVFSSGCATIAQAGCLGAVSTKAGRRAHQACLPPSNVCEHESERGRRGATFKCMYAGVEGRSHGAQANMHTLLFCFCIGSGMAQAVSRHTSLAISLLYARVAAAHILRTLVQVVDAAV